jgi:hypothetical protein
MPRRRRAARPRDADRVTAALALLLASGLVQATAPGPAPAPTVAAPAVPGAAKETAIRVKDVGAEYAHLRQHKLRSHMQSLVADDPRHAYDVLTATDEQGAERQIWFDISSFFGKGLGL